MKIYKLIIIRKKLFLIIERVEAIIIIQNILIEVISKKLLKIIIQIQSLQKNILRKITFILLIEKIFYLKIKLPSVQTIQDLKIILRVQKKLM